MIPCDLPGWIAVCLDPAYTSGPLTLSYVSHNAILSSVVISSASNSTYAMRDLLQWGAYVVAVFGVNVATHSAFEAVGDREPGLGAASDVYPYHAMEGSVIDPGYMDLGFGAESFEEMATLKARCRILAGDLILPLA